MAKVYVSSTFLDLKDCRARVNLALRKVGHEDVAMEYYVAGGERPVERCLADVAGCDLYVGLFAWRYGHVPEHGNPELLSVTEMEYRHARRLGKPCLIFLLSEDAAWPRKLMDRDATRIERLRAELGENHTVGSFTSAEDVAEAVYPAVYRWSEEHGQLPRGVSIPELDLSAYVRALTRRYQHLDLDALTPPQRDENLRQRLRETFVEQNVRESPPPVELPKEVWEKLQRDREIQAEDLPAGVTPEDVLRARESYFEKPSRPVLEALTDAAHGRAVVLGDPGSGKSTLSRYVLLSLLGVESDEKLRRAFEGHLPLLIELRSYAGLCARGQDCSFLDFVGRMSEDEGWGLDREALEHYLKEDGRAVVVFDGLDEIFDPEDREAAARRIAGFAERYPEARVLVTSRVIGYRRKVLADAGFSHFTLQDLDERQVEQFIDRWYALALDERPEEARARRERIMRSFKKSASIRQLAGNPMLLTIMAIIGKNQELPRERWKLYDHAAGVLIYHWDVERHLRDRDLDAPFIGEEEKKELLRRLAFRMQGGAGGLAGNYIHRDSLQREFETYLRDRFAQPPDKATTIARAMIDQFRSRNFILSLYGGNLYGFVHRAFLEFFCASAFVQKFEKTQELTLEELRHDVYGAHWEEQTWHEVLRLICGIIDEKFAGEIIYYLTDTLNHPPYEKLSERSLRNITLAVQCLSEVRNYSSITDAARRLLAVICSLFGQALNTVKVSTNVADQAGQVVNFLVLYLQHIHPYAQSIGSDWPDRTLIAEWLDAHGVLLDDVAPANTRDINTSIIVITLLSMFIGAVGGGDEAIHRVILSFASAPSRGRRLVAAGTLPIGWLESPETFSILRDMASQDKSEDVRGLALTQLAEMFSNLPGTLAILRDRAVNDESPANGHEYTSLSVRRIAISAIAEHWPSHPDTLPLLHERKKNDPAPKLRELAEKLANELEGKGSAQ